MGVLTIARWCCLGMFMIWRLKRLTTKRRADQGLTPIPDDNDIPDPVDHAEYVSVSGTPCHGNSTEGYIDIAM